MRSRFDDFRVTGFIQPGELGRARVQVDKVDSFGALRASIKGENLREGEEVTRLFVNNGLVMSDTRDEYRDHAFLGIEAKGRVLLHGLGLGCALKLVLAKDEVEHVDVVEIEQDVIDLIGPYFTGDPRVNLIHGDAFEQAKRWPRGSKWDAVWHDVWPNKSTEDLVEHAKLLRSFGRRAGWQGAWAHEELQRLRQYGW
jgi:hypothetical protein